MSKRTAARAAAITAALAKLSNSWGERKERQRMEKLRAYQEQIAASQLRERQYEESTRPTIEQKLADLERQRGAADVALDTDKVDLEAKKFALEKARQPKAPDRRSFKEIGDELGVGDEERFTALEALEASGNDFERAIRELGKPGQAGAGDSIDEGGVDVRARGRLLLQRARREFGAGQPGSAGAPGDQKRRAESQVDAVNMRSAMEHAAMVQNPNAAFEDKVSSWMTLEQLGMVRAPQEVKDWVKYGARAQRQVEQQIQQVAQPQGPARTPRPIRMSTTTTSEDRAAAERRRSVVPARQDQRQLVDYFTSGKLPAPTTGQPNNYPRDWEPPREGRRVSGPPYAQPQVGPPYHGVTPEQNRQLNIDEIMRTQPQAPVDPIQAMFDRIRALREGLGQGEPPPDQSIRQGTVHRGQGF